MKIPAALLALVLVSDAAGSQEAKKSPDGALDKSFNKTGKATVAFGSGEVFFPSHLAVQKDGKLVGVGILQQPGTVPLVSDGLLFRLNADGKPDASFGVNGRVRTDMRQTAERWGGLALQKDGKIVTAGDAFASPGGLNLNDLAIGRYLADGRLDPSFGAGQGFVFVDRNVFEQLTEVALQKDGKIIAVGSTTGFGGQTHLVALRLLTSGSPDPGFGTNGVVSTLVGGLEALALGVAVDKSGRILVVGSAGFLGTGQTNPFVARFLKSGEPDPKFDDDGFVVLSEIARPFGGGFQIAVQSDGKLVVSVTRFNATLSESRIGAYRLQSNGERDGGFGEDGLVSIALDTELGIGAGVLVDKKQRIILGSLVLNAARPEPALVRLTPAGKLDPTFGKGGKQVFNLYPSGAGFGGEFALQADGKIVMATAGAAQTQIIITRHLASN